jgi:hypothetical protein
MKAYNIFYQSFLTIIFVSLYLPTFIALPYTPQGEFYFPLWIFAVLLNYPKVALSQGFLASFSFVILHLIYQMFGLCQNQENTMVDYFWPMAFSFTVLEYFKASNNMPAFKRVIEITFICILLTSITSSISLNFFPSAARDMAGYLSSSGESELINFYLYIGIGNYSFFHNLALFVPLIMVLIINNRNIIISATWLIGILITMVYTVITGGFSSAFGLVIIGLAISMLLTKIKSRLRYVLLLSTIYLTFSTLVPLIAPLIYAVSDKLNSEFISPRLRNVAANLDGTSRLLDDQDLEYINGYEKQLDISIVAFKKNILTGSGISGGHHFWMDFLANFGIIGMIPWVIIMVYLVKSRTVWIIRQFRLVYFHIIITVIFFGLFKPIGTEVFVFISALFPAFIIYVQEYLLITSAESKKSKHLKQRQSKNILVA